MIDTISLDAHWRCQYLDREPDSPVDGFTVPRLSDFDSRRVRATLAWLEREFDLPEQDVCINYLLQVEALPVGTHLYLNGRKFGEITMPLSLDVTDLVALEDNRIAFRVDHGAAGAFGAVCLVAVPCES